MFPVVLAALALTSPQLDPSNFVDRVDNPYFPLKAGSVYRYEGSKDGMRALDVVKVTAHKKSILGVGATVVSDRLWLNGKLEERTSDWYAQDKDGNVWYLGEATAELDKNGKVKTTEGSWEAGVNGAQGGIFMPAHPRVGQSGLQEYYKGHAEDHFRILTTRARVKTPFVSSTRALRAKEWTPLEPGVVSVKYYLRGIGLVAEQDVKGGNEVSRLVSFQKG
jgi:hypothetical protein